MTSDSRFYIIMPNSSSESWGRWVWADAERRAILFLNNTTVHGKWRINLKKLHFSNTLNKRFWLPGKSVWDSTYPITPAMLDRRKNNYLIFHSGIKFSPRFIQELKSNYNVKIVLYLPDTLAGLSIAHNEEDWQRYRSYYELDQVYSFDTEDCKRYGLRFFDFYSITNLLPAGTPIDTDLFYIGSCRSPMRLKQARDVYEKVRRTIRCDFRMIGVPKHDVNNDDGIVYNKPMIYRDVIKQNQRSRCILELINRNQHGNTLRYKEAICYNRKLLTNNPDVLLSKYYNPRWIQYFERAEDIDVAWIINDDVVDFNYEGEFSPLRLLEMIENV